MPPARRSRVRGALGACDAPQGTLGAACPGARIPDAWTDRRGRAIPGRRRRYLVRAELLHAHAPMVALGAVLFEPRQRERSAATVWRALLGRRQELFAGSNRRRLAACQARNRGHGCRVTLARFERASGGARTRYESAISISAISVWLGAGASPGGQGLAGIGARVRRTRAAVHAHRMAGSRPAGL